MKIFLTFVLCFALVLSFVSAPVEAKKVGEVKEDIFTDNDHKFSMLTFNEWSVKIGSKSKSPLRLTMLQKSFAVSQEFQGAGKEDFAQIPTIKVLVDTCSASLEDFIAGLTDPKKKRTKQEKFFLKNLLLIKKPHEIKKSSDVTLQDAKAKILSVRQSYVKEVSQSGSDRATVVNGFISGYIFVTIREGKVYVVTLCSEYKQENNYISKWNQIVGSLKFEVE